MLLSNAYDNIRNIMTLISVTDPIIRIIPNRSQVPENVRAEKKTKK